jgi:hypothetical protein
MRKSSSYFCKNKKKEYIMCWMWRARWDRLTIVGISMLFDSIITWLLN